MIRIALLVTSLFVASLSQGQDILFECGQNSGKDFKGWFISPSAIFDAIEFDDHSAMFYSEFGGNYSVSISRKIDELDQFQELSLLFNFDVIDNAQINHVIYYTSPDGKKWNAVQRSANNTALIVENETLQISYVRAEVEATFFRNGKIACDYVKIEGNRRIGPPITTAGVEVENSAPTFSIFSYKNTLNIETGLEESYEVLITSINGQIVYRELFEGPQRLELPADFRGIYVVTIIQNNTFQETKKIII